MIQNFGGRKFGELQEDLLKLSRPKFSFLKVLAS